MTQPPSKERFTINPSGSQRIAALTMLFTSAALVLRPLTSIGTTAFIASVTGIAPEVFSVIFLFCGGVLLTFPEQSSSRFFALNTPLLFYMMMRVWFILSTPNAGLAPIAMDSYYAFSMLVYIVRRTSHAI